MYSIRHAVNLQLMSAKQQTKNKAKHVRTQSISNQNTTKSPEEPQKFF